MSQLLNDPALPVELEPVSMEKPALISDSIAGEKVNFIFGVNSRLETSVFNSEGDDDPDGILGNSTALIPFSPAHAWLKYAGASGIKLSSGVDIKSIGFGVDATAGLRSFAYRIHSATESLQDAIISDVVNLKTIFSKEHIKSLKTHEAVGLQFAGSLSASVTLSWSDVWSAGFKTLTAVLDASELVKIKFGAEASVKASVRIQDAFRTVIIKKGNNKYGLSISRSESSTAAASASLSIGVSLENPAVITNQLDTILENILQVSFRKLETIASKASGTLTLGETDILETVADRLGWKDGDDFPEKLKSEVTDLKKKYLDIIEEVVKARVKAGFFYEYLRLTEKESVFSGTLNEEALDKFHSEILKANTSKMIDYVLANPSSPILTDVKFLNTIVKKQERSWGFSIGFGNWVARDRHNLAMEFRSHQTEKGIQISYDGRRSFEDQAGKEKRRWKVDFNASMTQVSNYKIPLANEFDYSLYLNYEWEESKLQRDELTEFLDLCRLWNIINQGQFSELSESLFADLKKVKNVTYSCHATFPASLFKTIIVAMGNTSKVLDNVYYHSLGAALPYWKDFTLRTDLENRAKYYAPVWKEFLETDSIHPHEIAYAHLKRHDKRLAEKEYNYRPNDLINFDSFAFIANSNKQTLQRWQDFGEGIASLASAIDANSVRTHTPVISDAFRKMKDQWYFSHHMKAFGNFLVRVGEQYPSQFKVAVFTGEIHYKRDDKKEVMIIGKSS